MLDFLKKLYEKRSKVSDLLTSELWGIAAKSRDDPGLAGYRGYLCETYNVTEEHVDTLFAVYCRQIPYDRRMASWTEDIESYAIELGISQNIINTNKYLYPRAMMLRVHIRLLSDSAFDPEGQIASLQRERIETYISIFSDELDGLEFEDVLKSFKEFEQLLEVYVGFMDERLKGVSFEDAIKSFLEHEARIDPYLYLYRDKLEGLEFQDILKSFREWESRLEIYKVVCSAELEGLESQDIMQSFYELEGTIETYKYKLDPDLEGVAFEDLIVSALAYGRLTGIISDISEEHRTKGTHEDEMPEGKGEFGWEPTNPIPVASIREGYDYLNMLTTLQSDVSYIRIGSIKVDNIPSPVDEYKFQSSDGKELCNLYLNTYNSKTSKKLPQGFIWRS
jgi:hypothetical protein